MGQSDIVPTVVYDLHLESPDANGTTGWRVTVLLGGQPIATTIENTAFEAAVIGVGLYNRAMTPRSI
jgi:hypothetical protein